jgi:hypothetical protein
MTRWHLALAGTVCALALPIGRAHAQAATPTPIVAKSRKAEPHPRIRAAIRELEAAKVELQKAPHDFGGHRADAVAAVDKAIEQLRLALEYDKK